MSDFFRLFRDYSPVEKHPQEIEIPIFAVSIIFFAINRVVSKMITF
jgi:hypothetical protein